MRIMRKFALILFGCCCASQAFGQDPNLLMYEGFDYAELAELSPVPISSDPNDAANQGQLHVATGKYWFSAATGLRPTIAGGNVWFDNTLPAPTGNSLKLIRNDLNTASRIEISNRPNMPDDGSNLTFYWSGYFRLDRMVDDLGLGLTGAPSGRTVGEGGVFVAGFNNTPGPQTNNMTAIGGTLLLKRASTIPGSPLVDKFYIGTQSNNRDGCGAANNWECADRNFADYDATKDPVANPGADRTELPSVYWEESDRDDVRAKYPAVPIDEGQTVFLVGSMTVVPGLQNDFSRIWINPDSSTFGSASAPLPESGSYVNDAACPLGAMSCGFVESPTVLGTDIVIGANVTPRPADGVPAPGSASSIATFFQRMSPVGPAESYFDELRVGLTWASVTGGATDLVGDYNGDGTVDAADAVLWRSDPNSFGGDPDGYNDWRNHFGESLFGSGSSLAAAAPEPASAWLAALAAGWTLAARRRPRNLG
jgi:hypothetical protein